MKTRFIIVGAGNRGFRFFARAITGARSVARPEIVERAEVVAFVDANLHRARAAAREIRLPDLPVFDNVSAAAAAVPADWCIVAAPDFLHRRIVIDALEAGLDVFVDKPLATSAWECDLIIAAARRTGRQVRVGHNVRYSAPLLKAARLVREGAIGKVLQVEGTELLTYNHGGDYFHRWHSDFSRSAGLMTHKCCHDLDIACWVLDDDPVEVSAMGGRDFYTPRPDLNHGDRCLDCPLAGTCPHFFDIRKWEGMYWRIFKEAEGEDGYIRDACVFSDRHTINDHEVANIRFAGGALATFSLCAFAPHQHSYLNFTGTAGRLEFSRKEQVLYFWHGDRQVERLDFEAEHGQYGHGGADDKLLADMLGLPGSDPLQKAAPEEARRAVLIADLAARSIAAGGRPVRAEEAGHDFPPAPPSRR